VTFNVSDRTLAQLEATRRLQALDELKDTFLNAVPHELRTPVDLAPLLERVAAGASRRTRRGWGSGCRWCCGSPSCTAGRRGSRTAPGGGSSFRAVLPGPPS
jgi:hypothetical protein